MKSPKFLPKLKRRKLLVIRRISGRSMMPFLNPGQVVFAYGFFVNLKPNDIIIFFHDGREKIKRVSAVNGHEIIVIGDNENASMDSRHFGAIHTDHVIGKVIS